MICQSCQTFAGTFTKGNACCQIRLLMESPKPTRMATYATVRKEQGIDAMEQLKAAVHAEYLRKMEWKTKKGTAPVDTAGQPRARICTIKGEK